MFRIVYNYFKVDTNYKPIGKPIVKHVDGNTINELNQKFFMLRNENDLSKFTPLNFMDILEIKEH